MITQEEQVHKAQMTVLSQIQLLAMKKVKAQEWFEEV